MDVVVVLLGSIFEPPGVDVSATTNGRGFDAEKGGLPSGEEGKSAEDGLDLSRALDDDVWCSGGIDKLGTPEVGTFG